MRTIRLEVAYDGARFSGWQTQPAQKQVRTIQEELERAAEKITGVRPEVIGSGRTDAGVHALCQTAAFRTDASLPAEKFLPALNAELPPEIRVLRSSEAADDFHPIRDVTRKRYRYLLSDSRPVSPFLKDYVWFVYKRLDFERMWAAAPFLLGTHDFSAFETVGSPRKSSVRTIFDASVIALAPPTLWSFPKAERGEISSGEIYAIEVEADGFLYNMVRAIAGTLCAVGQGRDGFERPERVGEIIERADRSLAGPTAPPHGLYMIDVAY